jgi:hypothetical protein
MQRGAPTGNTWSWAVTAEIVASVKSEFEKYAKDGSITGSLMFGLDVVFHVLEGVETADYVNRSSTTF